MEPSMIFPRQKIGKPVYLEEYLNGGRWATHHCRELMISKKCSLRQFSFIDSSER